MLLTTVIFIGNGRRLERQSDLKGLDRIPCVIMG